mmetsp:Transcript_75950/g.165695  ORF Transcript_75950/g.165695 Transcript_75950/m.165695 type:complete len:476 (+) Transcript_75950:155-1582(+)
MSGAGDAHKVFVGGLPQSATREVLNAHFSQYGPSDAYVMIDKASGRSRGFGFVNFETEQGKEAALAAPNHEVHGMAISVTPYNQSQSGGGGGGGGGRGGSLADTWDAGSLGGGIGIGGGGGGGAGKPIAQRDQLKVFVGGLSQSTTREGLTAYFQQFGQADAFIMIDKTTGRSRGFGFVNFTDEAVMNMVLQTKHEVDGAAITVSAYTEKQRSFSSSASGFGGSSVGGYGPVRGGGGPPAHAGDNALAQVQAALVNLTGVVGALTAGAGQPGHQTQLSQLLQSPQISNLLHKVQSQATQLARQPGMGSGLSAASHSSAGRGRGNDDKAMKIFVGGLSQNTTRDSLTAYFSQFGAADGIVMMDKGTGRSRGFGFVDFDDELTMNEVLRLSHTIDGALVNCSPYGSGGGGGGRGGGAGGGGGGGFHGGCGAGPIGGGGGCGAASALASALAGLTSLQEQLNGAGSARGRSNIRSSPY